MRVLEQALLGGVLLLTSVVVINAQEAQDFEDWMRTRLYADCRPVAARASLFGDGAPEALMPDLAATLDTLVKSRLTAARLFTETPDLPNGLVLYVDVELGDRGDDGRNPLRLYRLSMDAKRYVTIPLTGEKTLAEVWSADHGVWGYAGRLEDIEISVERAASKSLDEFVLEYMAANEPSCETSTSR